MKNKTQGFTIIEILVALLILSLLSAMFFYVTSANSSIFRRTDERSRIITYSQDIVERLKIDWSDPAKFQSRAPVAVPVAPVAGYTVDPLSIQFLKPDGTVVTSGPYVTQPVLYQVTLTIRQKGAVYYKVSVRIGHPVPPSI